VWSVGGSPPWGVSYDEAAAVYELIEDYQGIDTASSESYTAVLRPTPAWIRTEHRPSRFPLLGPDPE
jgi:hypothetical protein